MDSDIKEFIIGGASRAGKSCLAQKLKKRFSLNWIIGDAFVSSIEDAFPEIGISHDGNMLTVAEKYETFLKYLLWNYTYEGGGYVFDTTHLRPQNIINIRDKIGSVPTVYIGYADVDPMQKLEEIRRFDPQEDWWTVERSDADLITHIKNQIERSHEDRIACEKFGIPYFDTSKDFEKVLDSAFEWLVSETNKSKQAG